MKKLIAILALIILLQAPAFGELPTFEAGVKLEPTQTANIYYYQEMNFMSGEPKLFIGTVLVPEIPEDRDDYTISYTYTLQEEGNPANTIERQVIYDITKVTEVVDGTYTQTLYDYDLTLQESIEMDGKEYILASVTHDQPIFKDNTPAVDFMSGILELERKYWINGDQFDNEGEVLIRMVTRDRIGYSHMWGQADTHVIDMEIMATSDDGEAINNWDGLVDIKLSSTLTTSFEKRTNDTQTISFLGNYYKRTTEENILQYTYDLPLFDEEGAFERDSFGNFKRNKGEESLSSGVRTSLTSLVTPKFKDIAGHWAEERIKLATSLGIFKVEDFFAPNLPISRLEFARAVANSLTEFDEATRADIVRRAREEKVFKDIDYEHPYYDYIAYLKETKLMVGEGGYFLPDRTITREEAFAIMIRSLGIEHLAPARPYNTGFVDDGDIGNWAKDYIYMAREIGLAEGYEDGSIRPKKTMTRAEATAMILRYIDHIKDDIKYDYREKIINRY